MENSNHEKQLQKCRKIPETYAQYFIRKYQNCIKDSSIDSILQEFCRFMRPKPGKYTATPAQYSNEFIELYVVQLDKFEIEVILESFTLFITHCNSFAVNWVFYSHENEL